MKPGTRVLVLGAGLAGMLSAYELRKAGYHVQVLEFQNRSGGRNISLRGGDTVTELGGATQKVGFAPGNYINPGPWRIPYHHQGLLHYCREFGVALEPFIELNHNTWLHSSEAFGGRPVRYRELSADFNGFTAELLAKAIDQHRLDDAVSAEEREYLRTAMQEWGRLDAGLSYGKGALSSGMRGYDRAPGGDRTARPPSRRPSRARMSCARGCGHGWPFTSGWTCRQPCSSPWGHGHDRQGFNRQVHDLITLNCKVTAIHQDDRGVRVTYNDMGHGGVVREAQADYCVCTIPLPVLSQLDVQVGAALRAAIMAVPYVSSVKMGLEFRRRFWEEDEQIYGGISFTDQQINQISYPSNGFSPAGRGAAGGYMFGPAAYDFAGMTPAERLEHALAQGRCFIPSSIARSFPTASVLPGAGCRGAWAAVRCGMNRPARPITRPCVPWITGSYWRVSMHPM
ncbi:FAD-dependent oxidoreductase [Komagataeibacter rhaeticus]|nr:FAD-dependent oxidoreductase [Komagataeibacter rhaeticus]